MYRNNKWGAVVFTVMALFCLCGFTNPFTRDKSLPPSPTRQVVFHLTGVLGNPSLLSAEDVERRLGVKKGELASITLTELPQGGRGVLYLDGQPVSVFQTLNRQELNRLIYYPDSNQQLPAAFSFIPQCGDGESFHVAVSITLTGEEKKLPLLKDDVLTTMGGMTAVKTILAGSLDMDSSLTFQVSKGPQKGQVVFENNRYSYTPFQNTKGQDSFSFFAKDGMGNITREAVVSVWIEEAPSVRFEDMAASPSEYAAVQLWQRGVMTGEKVGGHWLFYPSRQITRLDYLIFLLSAIGQEPVPCVNTELKGDSGFPLWAKPYIKAGIEQGIITENIFTWDTVPTRAEAVLLTDRAADITGVKHYALDVSDLEEIPQWALPSYMNLGAYRMLDFHDGYARPLDPLTREGAADLLWQLCKLKERGK